MTSDLVSNEWHYALALNRPGFIRPVYWERPRPVLPERNLPPPELDRLHFSYLPVRIEPPMLAEPSYPGPPVGPGPATTTGQAPVASAEAGPPAIGWLASCPAGLGRSTARSAAPAIDASHPRHGYRGGRGVDRRIGAGRESGHGRIAPDRCRRRDAAR